MLCLWLQFSSRGKADCQSLEEFLLEIEKMEKHIHQGCFCTHDCIPMTQGNQDLDPTVLVMAGKGGEEILTE